jgi:hypothetical protein
MKFKDSYVRHSVGTVKTKSDAEARLGAWSAFVFRTAVKPSVAAANKTSVFCTLRENKHRSTFGARHDARYSPLRHGLLNTERSEAPKKLLWRSPFRSFYDEAS